MAARMRVRIAAALHDDAGRAHLLQREEVARVRVVREVPRGQREPPDLRVIGQRDADHALVFDREDRDRVLARALLEEGSRVAVVQLLAVRLRSGRAQVRRGVAAGYDTPS